MTDVSGLMGADHEACDATFVELEDSVSRNAWAAADAAMTAFRHATLRHFGREERVLFPTFEAAIGSADGPTAVMRMEHDQVRSLFEALAAAVASRSRGRCLGLCESLMILIQQHNMKEEQILYPMADRVLPDPAAVVAKMLDVQCEEG